MSAQELAETATTREKFSFADAIRNRNYPTTVVDVIIAEDVVHEFLHVQDQIKATLPDSEGGAEKLEALEARLAELTQELKDSTYHVTIKGINSRRIQELVDKSQEMYPTETEDIPNPINGIPRTVVKPNPDQDRYFMDLVWTEYIHSIESPDGAIDTDITLENIADIKELMGVQSRNRIEDAINEVQMASEWYKGIVDEVF